MQRRRDSLFEQCKADEVNYFAHPKPPLLKSCVDYKRLFHQGLKDTRLGDQCSEDLIEELPTCKRWKETTQILIQTARESAERSHENLERERLREGW
jgi:hypothetical protein